MTSASGGWTHSCGRVHYYTLDNEFKPAEPFGKIGPFPSPREMRAAMDLLSARFPEAIIASRKRSLAEDLVSDSTLDAGYAESIRKLAIIDIGDWSSPATTGKE